MILLVFDSSDKTMYRSLTSKWLSLITSTVPDVFTLCGAYIADSCHHSRKQDRSPDRQ